MEDTEEKISENNENGQTNENRKIEKNAENDIKQSIYYPTEFKPVVKKRIFRNIRENFRKFRIRILGQKAPKLLSEKFEVKM